MLNDKGLGKIEGIRKAEGIYDVVRGMLSHPGTAFPSGRLSAIWEAFEGLSEKQIAKMSFRKFSKKLGVKTGLKGAILGNYTRMPAGFGVFGKGRSLTWINKKAVLKKAEHFGVRALKGPEKKQFLKTLAFHEAAEKEMATNMLISGKSIKDIAPSYGSHLSPTIISEERRMAKLLGVEDKILSFRRGELNSIERDYSSETIKEYKPLNRYFKNLHRQLQPTTNITNPIEGLRAPKSQYDKISGINPSVKGISPFGSGRDASKQINYVGVGISKKKIISGSKLLGNVLGIDIETLGIDVGSPITIAAYGEFEGITPVGKRYEYPIKLQSSPLRGSLEDVQVYESVANQFKAKRMYSQVGDFINPEIKGVLQFPKPKKIIDIQTRGGLQYAKFEGSDTYIPLKKVKKQFKRIREPLKFRDIDLTDADKIEISDWINNKKGLSNELKDKLNMQTTVNDSKFEEIAKGQMSEYLKLSKTKTPITAKEFNTNFISTVLNGKHKNIWIQNINFESIHLGLHMTSDDYERMGLSSEGMSATYQRMFPTSEKIANAKNALYKTQLYKTLASGEKVLLTESEIRTNRILASKKLFETILEELSSKSEKPGVRIFDALDVSRSMLGLAQMHAKKYGFEEVKTIGLGASGDLWAEASGDVKYSHLPYSDIHSMFKRVGAQLEIGQKLLHGVPLEENEISTLRNIFATNVESSKANLDSTLGKIALEVHRGHPVRIRTGEEKKLTSIDYSTEGNKTKIVNYIESEIVGGQHRPNPKELEKYLNKLLEKRTIGNKVLKEHGQTTIENIMSMINRNDESTEADLMKMAATSLDENTKSSLMKTTKKELHLTDNVLSLIEKHPVKAAGVAATGLLAAYMLLSGETPEDRQKQLQRNLSRTTGRRPIMPNFPSGNIGRYNPDIEDYIINAATTQNRALENSTQLISSRGLSNRDYNEKRLGPRKRTQFLRTAGLVQHLHDNSMGYTQSAQSNMYRTHGQLNRQEEYYNHPNTYRGYA